MACVVAKPPNFNCGAFSLVNIIKLSGTILHANYYSNISAVKRHLTLSGQIDHLCEVPLNVYVAVLS